MDFWSTSGGKLFYMGGNVGIGITNPQSKLDVNGSMVVEGTSVGGAQNQIIWVQPGLSPASYGFAAITSDWNNSGGGQQGSLQFQTKGTASSLLTRMWIDKDGNVGIGTTTPGSKLTVSGHIGTLGTIPTLTSAGTGASITTGSTDTAGEITEGTLATGAVITFATAYTNVPFAIVVSEAGLLFSYTVSTTAITITNIGALSSSKLTYHVIARE